MASFVAVEEVSLCKQTVQSKSVRFARWRRLRGHWGKFTHLYKDDIGPGFGQANGDGLPDAAGGTGDEGGLAFEGEEAGGHGVFLSMMRVIARWNKRDKMDVVCLQRYVGTLQ
jgi:hypothetical protein